MSPPDGGWGWVVVIASLVAICIADGVSFSFGLFFPHLISEFSESATTTAWIGGLYISVPLLSGPLCSALVERFGNRAMCILGGLLSAIGFVASAFITWLPLMYVTFGLVSGLGIGLIFITAVVSISQWFDKRRTLAISLSATGTGIGTLLFAPLIDFFLSEYGWRGAVLLLAGLLLNMCVCGSVMWEPVGWRDTPRNRPRKKSASLSDAQAYQSLLTLPTYTKVQEKTKEDVPRKLALSRAAYSLPLEKCFLTDDLPQLRRFSSQRDSNLNFDKPTLKALSCPDVLKRSTLKVPLENSEKECIDGEGSKFLRTLLDFSLFLESHFLIFSISTILLFTWYIVPYYFLLELMKNYDYTENQASSLLSVIGISNTLGLVIMGLIGDQPWLHVTKAYVLCLLGTGIATGAMPFAAPYPAALVVAASAFGLLVAGNFSFTPTILVELVHLDRFTIAYGLILLCQGIGSLVGPPIAAFAFDIFKNWDLSFYLSGSWIIFAGLIMMVVPATENLKFGQSTPAWSTSRVRSLPTTSL